MTHKLFKKEIRPLTLFFTELFAKKSKVRIHEKKIGSHKPYNILKTIAFRLEIPFASCYSDISYLLKLKNISRMIKNSKKEFLSALGAMCDVHLGSPWKRCAARLKVGPWAVHLPTAPKQLVHLATTPISRSTGGLVGPWARDSWSVAWQSCDLDATWLGHGVTRCLTRFYIMLLLLFQITYITYKLYIMHFT